MTSIDGIYAAGDIVEKSYYQLITAANDGVVAALDIIDKQK
jgi:thioredoxin reductase